MQGINGMRYLNILFYICTLEIIIHGGGKIQIYHKRKGRDVGELTEYGQAQK